MSRLTQLIGEIHRRSLWQVLGIYLVGGWMAYEVVLGLAEGFGLPAWFPRLAVALLILGLPIVLATAFVQERPEAGTEHDDVVPERGAPPSEQAPAGSRQRPRRPAAEPGRRLLTWRNAVLTLVGLFAIWGVAAAGWLLFAPPGPAATGGPSRPTMTGVAADRKMIVVLPFENLGAPDDAYFADGVTEELTSRLALVDGLGVIARTTAIQYRNTDRTVKQIGQELGVDYVLEGTVRWARSAEGRDEVRVTPQLVRTSDETHVWAGSYDRELREIFRIQSEIALSVVKELNVALGRRQRQLVDQRPTDNMEAYDAYLRGNDYKSKGYAEEYYRDALAMYEKAAAVDPGFWWAYLAAADAHTFLYFLSYDHTPERCELARKAIERAASLAPDHPYVHSARAMYYYRCFLDYDRASAEMDVALRDLPNDGSGLRLRGYIQRRQGRLEAAAENLERAFTLAPRSASSAVEIANTYEVLRRYDDARRFAERAIALNPGDGNNWAWLAEIVEKATGSIDSARAVLEASTAHIDRYDPITNEQWFRYELLGHDYDAALRTLDHMPQTDFWVAILPVPFRRAQVYDLMGRRDEARAAYQEARTFLEQRLKDGPDDPRVLTTLGQVYASLGRRDDAVRAAARAVALMPPSRDALAAPHYAYDQAITLATVGDTAAAIDILERLLATPTFVDPVYLRVEPWWDPLRDNPRFQRLANGG